MGIRRNASGIGVIELEVPLGARSYPIHIGSDILKNRDWWTIRAPEAVVALVTDENVSPLYASGIAHLLEGLGKRVVNVVLPAGESSKSWPILDRLFDKLLDARCDRDCLMVALGGGVIGDLAGFAASTYLRGIPLIQVPTTLLAQVDSSVGGKNGINHARGKNMIGTFNQPRAVLIDVDTLDTLPRRELVAGLAEVIKHGAIADAAYFEWLEHNLEALLQGEPEALIEAVRGSCLIKAKVVAADEREAGVRAILNFGHTFAHAIETGLGFGFWLHGEAVGCGMVQAAELSVRTEGFDPLEAQRLSALIARTGLPTVAPDLGPDRWLELMALDKKTRAGSMRFVVLEAIGRARLRSVPEGVLLQVLAQTATLGVAKGSPGARAGENLAHPLGSAA